MFSLTAQVWTIFLISYIAAVLRWIEELVGIWFFVLLRRCSPYLSCFCSDSASSPRNSRQLYGPSIRDYHSMAVSAEWYVHGTKRLSRHSGLLRGWWRIEDSNETPKRRERFWISGRMSSFLTAAKHSSFWYFKRIYLRTVVSLHRILAPLRPQTP